MQFYPARLFAEVGYVLCVAFCSMLRFTVFLPVLKHQSSLILLALAI